MKRFINNKISTGDSRSGVSLIEVMFAILLLSIMAVGGAAYLQHSRAESYAQVARRLALEVANTRLEELAKADYTAISPPLLNYQPYYITGSVGSWTVSATDPLETAPLNGITVPMRTEVTYVDIEGDGDSYDYLHVKVYVAYRTNGDATVRMELYIEP